MTDCVTRLLAPKRTNLPWRLAIGRRSRLPSPDARSPIEPPGAQKVPAKANLTGAFRRSSGAESETPLLLGCFRESPTNRGQPFEPARATPRGLPGHTSTEH